MASTLSLKELSTAANGAVHAALERHKLKATNEVIINPGTLAGPLLDRATDLKVAQQLAEEITKQVQTKMGGPAAAGDAHAQAAAPKLPQLQSGVLVTNRYIICGFFPWEVPQINVEKF
jgi:hypothetical protein